MFFEDRDTYDDKEYKEFHYPVYAKIEELKKEKEQLEEYYRQLIFIKKILEYIIIEYSDNERRNFNIVLKDPKYIYLNDYIIQALNTLLKDSPSLNNSFSKIEIEEYLKKLYEESEKVDARINAIIHGIQRFEKK
jgi:hypothetical protein